MHLGSYNASEYRSRSEENSLFTLRKFGTTVLQKKPRIVSVCNQQLFRIAMENGEYENNNYYCARETVAVAETTAYSSAERNETERKPMQ